MFSFKSGYYALSDEDSVKFNHNIICFAFSDVSRLDEIARKVSEMPDVYGVYLYGSVKAGGIQCGTRLPLMEENRLLTGEISEELSEGEIITSYAFSSGIKRDAQSNPDEEFTVKEDEGNDFSREYIGSGETVCLDGIHKSFISKKQSCALCGGNSCVSNNMFNRYCKSSLSAYEQRRTIGVKKNSTTSFRY